MKKPIFLFALIVFLTVSACAFPIQTKWSVSPIATSNTHTPSQTAVGTTTPEVLGTVPVQSTPSQAKRVMPDGVVNLMILGSDWRPSSGHRTDVVMLVSVNTIKQTVSVVSFPRD